MTIENNEINSTIKLPEPSVRRLPVYLHYLKTIENNEGFNNISCTQIATELGLNPIQVRKDLEITGIEGKPKVGYETKSLIKAIESFFGFSTINKAVLIGAGNLGKALLGYEGFKEYGLDIVAAFDADASKIGTDYMGKKVLDIATFGIFLSNMNGIKVAVLTVPAAYAQETADKIVEAGIKVIWNFAPQKITVKPDILVLHENLASSLAVLIKNIAAMNIK